MAGGPKTPKQDDIKIEKSDKKVKNEKTVTTGPTTKVDKNSKELKVDKVAKQPATNNNSSRVTLQN